MAKKYPRKTIVNMTILCAATGIVSLSSGIFSSFMRSGSLPLFYC
ncbi:hypothetical protein SAMN05444349_110127 [Bacteroides faecichinchillae]|uniref:Uncharacterized protein n=1 Tax=Bacteroides faecichinchillae TaxID=871325 RepID=A0A1M4YJ27_9BACE|nr:hypothetical protein SAMN05444349_110127 [Bacteroides faecichinchillae]